MEEVPRGKRKSNSTFSDILKENLSAIDPEVIAFLIFFSFSDKL